MKSPINMPSDMAAKMASSTPFDALTKSAAPVIVAHQVGNQQHIIHQPINHPSVDHLLNRQTKDRQKTDQHPIWLADILAAKKRIRRVSRQRYVRFIRWSRNKVEALGEFICDHLDTFTGASGTINELYEEREQTAQRAAQAQQQLEQLQQELEEQKELAGWEEAKREDLERVVLLFESETKQALDDRDKAILALRQNINDLIQDKLLLTAEVSHWKNCIQDINEGRVVAADCLEDRYAIGGDSPISANHGSHNQLTTDYLQPSQSISPLPRPFQKPGNNVDHKADYKAASDHEHLPSNNHEQLPTSRVIYITTICPPLEIDGDE